MLRVKFLIIFLIICCKTWGQTFVPDPDWRFENFDSHNHFETRDFYSLTTDKHGYLWTSAAGVQRFDGYHFLSFNSITTKNAGLKDNYTDEVTDNQGRVWVSSLGICYYDDVCGKFIYIQPEGRDPLKYAYALSIQGNTLWFLCNYGLAKLNLTTLKMSFTSMPEVKNPVYIGDVGNKTLLVTGSERMYLYNTSTNTFTSRLMLRNKAIMYINTSVINSKGLYLVTSAGLFLFKSYKDIDLEAKPVWDGRIEDAVFMPQDKQKRYLFTNEHDKGITVFDTQLNQVTCSYSHDVNNPFSILSDKISRLHVDKDQRLWVGTLLGISMLDINNQKWRMRYFDKNSGQINMVAQITRDVFDTTKVWMSNLGTGLLQVDWRAKKTLHVYNSYDGFKNINDIHQIARYKFLLLSQAGLTVWDSQNNKVIKTFKAPTDMAFNIRYHKIIKAQDSIFYITTTNGLLRFDLNKQTLLPALSKSDSYYNHDMQNGFYANGELWIARTYGGLFYHNTITGKSVLYNDSHDLDSYFFDVSPAADGWLVSPAFKGVALFNLHTKQFKHIHVLANLNGPKCLTTICVNHVIWIATEAGLVNYDMATGHSFRIEYESPLLELYPSSLFAKLGNEIGLGFRQGYAYFTPDLQNVPLPSNPVIESFTVNNKPVEISAANANLSLDHKSNSINIAFTAFLYTAPGDIDFRYKLTGAESDWQDAGDVRSANYAQLEPGDYTFYLQSGNNGIWNKHLASVHFIIRPPFYKTWWFITLAVLALCFLISAVYRYRVNQLLKLERVRNKIATDLHDDIGSALSSISIFSEVARKQLDQNQPNQQTKQAVDQIAAQSRTILDAMDDIIWAVNPENDHVVDLAIRMREFAIPLLEAKGISFDIDIPSDITRIQLSMVARKNIFMIFKESINNVVKHADCTRISISVKKINNQLILLIADNGKGFDPNALNTRNGLKNLRKRAEEISAVLNISSLPGKGTTTELLVNII